MWAWFRYGVLLFDWVLRFVAIPHTTLGIVTAVIFALLTWLLWTRARRWLRYLVTKVLWRLLVITLFLGAYNLAMRDSTQRWLQHLFDDATRPPHVPDDSWH